MHGLSPHCVHEPPSSTRNLVVVDELAQLVDVVGAENLDLGDGALRDDRLEELPDGVEDPGRVDDEHFLHRLGVVRLVERDELLGEVGGSGGEVRPAETAEILDHEVLAERRASLGDTEAHLGALGDLELKEMMLSEIGQTDGLQEAGGVEFADALDVDRAAALVDAVQAHWSELLQNVFVLVAWHVVAFNQRIHFF
jgi:hypothetical protein